MPAGLDRHSPHRRQGRPEFPCGRYRNEHQRVTNALNGTATLTALDGALTGFDVEQLLRRLERRPLSGAGDFRSGRTPYDRLNIALKLERGIATAEDVRIEGPAVRLVLGGSASIPNRDIDLTGSAQLV